LAGLSAPATVQFPSLGPLLRGEKECLFDFVYCAYRGFQRMVRSEEYKLILYPEAKKLQLFDLKKDPWEMNNLAGDSTQSAIVADLFSQLEKWQEKTNDRLVLDRAAFGIRS
jgi:arylsulfatase A-like enzyme